MDIDLIERLKKRYKAVIIAHNYQLPEVQEIADFTGDSLEMAFRAMELSSDVIIVAGVKFMAELVAAINPDKIVLHPDPTATCPLADKINVQLISEVRERFKGLPIVVYDISPIEVKALADFFVTCSFATRLISKLGFESIIFSPDNNVASYISEKTNVNVIPIPSESYCPIYEHLIDEYYVKSALKIYPNAKLLVHMGVSPKVRRLAHYVGGNSQMIKAIGDIEGEVYLLGAEEGLAYRAKRIFSDKTILPVNSRAICLEMKKITPRKIIECLNNLKPKISIDREIIVRARRVIFNSLDILS